MPWKLGSRPPEAWAHRPPSGLAESAKQHVSELVPVDRQGDRLPQRLVVERRLVDVPLEGGPSGRWLHLGHSEARLVAETRDVLRVHVGRDVDFTGPHHGQPDRRIGNHAVDDAVQVRLAFFPVVREPLQGDLGIAHPLDEPEGARAYRAPAEILPQLLRRGRRHHEARAFREGRQQRGEGLLQLDRDRVRVDDRHRRDGRFQLGALG